MIIFFWPNSLSLPVLCTLCAEQVCKIKCKALIAEALPVAHPGMTGFLATCHMLFDLRYVKTNVFLMRKQRCRSASR